MASWARPTSSEQVAHGFLPLLRRAAVGDVERLGDDLLDTHARIERGVGILEHELQVAA